MPMCLFGCDKLYEEGYIFVNKNGIIEQSNKMMTSKMLNHIKSIKYTVCYDFNNEREKYFEWHKNFHLKLSNHLMFQIHLHLNQKINHLSH